MTSISSVYAKLSMMVKQTNVWFKKQTFTDYTDLGGVAIKLIELTGTTDASASGTASVAHGLTASQILSVSVQVTAGSTIYLPNSPVSAEEFSVTIDAANINIINGGSATTILDMPLTVLITYSVGSSAPPVTISASQWRIYITANNGHSNTSIVEITFKDSGGTPISYVGGTASASSQFSGTFAASRAFDGSTATRWATTTVNPSVTPQWIEMAFAAPVAPFSVDIQSNSGTAGEAPKDFAIQYYDGAIWQSLTSYTNETGWTALQIRNFVIQ